MSNTKFAFYLVIFVTAIILLALGIFEGMTRHEIKECKKWQAQAREFPTFYLIGWQTEQCKAHGIEIEVKQPRDIKGHTITAIVYAYNSKVDQTDGDPYTMASGNRVYDGAVACPTRLPFGTRVEFAGKVYTCEDRMSKRYRDGNYFDIWMETKDEAVEWGKQQGLMNVIY